MFKVNIKDTRTMPLTSFSCLLCWLLTYVKLFSNVSIVDFKQVNVSGKVFLSLIMFKRINNELILFEERERPTKHMFNSLVPDIH